MTELEEGYISTPSLSSEHIKHLEFMLERAEKDAEVGLMFAAHNAPSKYEEYKQDAEALRYAIDVVKWVEDMFYKKEGGES